MPDSTLRIVAEGQLAELREYVQLIERADRALESFNRTAGSAPAGTGGGGGGGSAMMGPTAPGPSPARAWSDDAPTEVIPGRGPGGAAPSAPRTATEAREGRGPGPSTPAAPSDDMGPVNDPDATAARLDQQRAAMFRAARSSQAGSAFGGLIGGAVGGAFGGAVGQEAGGMIDSIMGRSGTWQRAATSALTLNPVGTVWHGAQAAGKNLYDLASWGIGEDPIQMIMGSGSKYMQISTALAQVSHQFREAAKGAELFGNSMGFTLSQAAGLSQALGAQTDSIDPGAGVDYLGFARNRGLDPMQAMHTLGSMSRLQESRLSGGQLMAMGGRASLLGMGQGRLGEYQRQVLAIMEQQHGRSGRADAESAGLMTQFTAAMFGGGEAGLGMSGANLVQRMSGGFDRPAVKSTMLRALGYGQQGGPSYVDAMQQIEEGATDPQNLYTLYDYLRNDGVGGDGMKVVMGQAFGLKMFEADALVGALANPDVRALMSGDKSKEGAVKEYMRSLTPRQRGAFGDDQDFGGLGRLAVSAGESYAVKKESLVMKFGPKMADLQLDVLNATDNVVQTVQNLIGDGLGNAAKQATEALEDFTGAMRDLTEPGGGLPTRNGARVDPLTAALIFGVDLASGRQARGDGAFSTEIKE